ncbi:MAG: calcium-binding protein [Actinobacteria bacterium HGW-Actinobacteria-2]|nr:MAG: calcium-binding protein [Actinobacteria bacterium HGW-Actinobacteria-2]
MRITVAALVSALVITPVIGVSVTTTPAQAAPVVRTSVVKPQALKYKFKNCTALNKVYANGVGKKNAKDHTSGTPVTSFLHSDSLYKKIIKYRKSLDRDKDGIACERA